jgi:hypothetical protein
MPRAAARRHEYERSDALVTMPLPAAEAVQALTRALAAAVAEEDPAQVERRALEVLTALSEFHAIPVPGLRVLGVRPHRVISGVCTYQLFGDYTPSNQRIRVWMRTAIREKVSSPKALLNTLLHEFCHHLDCTRLGWRESYHTRGFFARIDHLYHHALGTPPGARRPLRWVKRGGVWAIDWSALNRRR